MKYIVSILIVILLLASCSPEKMLKKSINKYGQKESARYFLKHYKEYFQNKDTSYYIVKYDTIYYYNKPDTITATFNCLEDSFQYENEKMKLSIRKLQDRLYYVFATCKGDTLYIPVTDTVYVYKTEYYAPNVVNDKKNSSIFSAIRENLWYILSLLFIIVLTLAYFLGKKNK